MLPLSCSPRSSDTRFKPLSGIRSSAMIKRDRLARPATCVSNPCREFVPLQSRLNRDRRGFQKPFQTPVGNSFLCNKGAAPGAHADLHVSNPCREFVPLQSAISFGEPSGACSVSNPCREFVPLQLGLVERVVALEAFQTPVGNSFLCNPGDRSTIFDYTNGFQTPVGNSFLCNEGMRTDRRISSKGFKPLSGIRSSAIWGITSGTDVYWKFQTPVGNSFLCNFFVQICRLLRRNSFKPLSGIRSSAIVPLENSRTRDIRVSNPCREFVPLQYSMGSCNLCRRRVSNPCREFVPLQYIIEKAVDFSKVRLKPL